MPLRRSVADEDLTSSRQGSQALSADDHTDITEEASYQHDPTTHQAIRQQQQQKQQQQVAQQPVVSTKDFVQRSGTPGPGRYDLPSTFVNVGATQNASSYVLATPHLGASIKGRNWPAPDDPVGNNSSPGPLAYAPVLEAASAKRKAPRAVFSAADRDKQDKIYLGSEGLNRSASRSTSPGPQAYRVAVGRKFGRQSPGPPVGPRATFGANRSAPSHLTAAISAAAQKRSKTSLGFYADRAANGNLSTGISIKDHHGDNVKREYPWRPRSCEPGARPVSVEVFDPAAFLAGAAKARTTKDLHSALTAAAGLGETQDTSPNSRSKSPVIKAFYREGIGGHAWSFGPPGGLAAGQQRRRSREGNVYISPQHATADPGPKAARSIPGAGAYDIGNRLQVLSTHRVEGITPFGTAERGKAKLYLSPDLVKVDPSLTYSPGPGTAGADILGSLSASVAGSPHSARIGPRFGSPTRNPAAKQPVISRQHDIPGHDSPGPAAYDTVAATLAGTTLGNRRTAHFGTGARNLSGGVVRTFAPGPGAYYTEEVKSSAHASSPAYSLGAATHRSKTEQTPGVGAYSITSADRQVLHNSGKPTMKGKLEHGGITTKSDSPGPAAYMAFGGIGQMADIDWRLRWGAKYPYCHATEPQSQNGEDSQHQNDNTSGEPAVALDSTEQRQQSPTLVSQQHIRLNLSPAVSKGSNAGVGTSRSGCSMLSLGRESAVCHPH